MGRIIRTALLLLGVLLVFTLFHRIGLTPVMSAVARLSWSLPLLLLVPACLIVTCDTLGWRFAFRRDGVPFGALLRARLAGEAINVTTPVASLGGEPVKTWLIRAYAPLSESVPSVIIAKTTLTIGQVLFVLMGVLAAGRTLPDGSELLRAMRWLVIVQCFAVSGFAAVQALGAAGAVGRALERLGFSDDRGPRALGSIDREFAQFYRRAPGRLTLSVLWHLAGWTAGLLEGFLDMRALSLPVSLSEAMVVEAVDVGIGFAAFLIPARTGVQEAGHVAAFVALGLGAPLGLAFTVVRRLRQAVWAGIGYLALASAKGPAGHPPHATTILEREA
jgi:uncharacterized protein (TIRG00374 family)